MEVRKVLKYPPYYNLSIIKIVGKDYDTCMDEGTKIQSFLRLANIFNNYGFRLYLVGGTVRDYLSNKELTDLLLERFNVLKTY